MSNPFDAFDKPIETSLEDQTPNLMTGPGVSVAAVDPEAEALKTQAADWFNLSAQQERFHGLMSAFGRELEGHPAYNFPSIEEYTPNAFDQFDPPKPQPFNIGGILGSDIQRGLGTALEMQGAGMRQYGLPGASVIERGGQTQQERAGEGAGPQSVFDIKSAKDVGQWFGRNVLEGLGTSLPTIGAGIAGTVTGGPLAGFAAVQGSSNLLGVGQARLALEREQDMLLRKAERAAQLGQWELRSQIQQEVAQLDPQKHEALILAAGAIIGGLESVAPWMTMLKESPLSLSTAVRGEVVRYIMGHLAKRAGTGAIQEGVTEALQSVAEVVTIAKAKGAKAAYDYLKAINDNRYKILDEALAGAAGGAGLGGVGGMRDAALAYRRRDRVGEQTEGEGAAPTGQPSVPSAGGVELPEGFQLPQGQTSTETVSREAPSTVTTPQMPDADQAVALWRAAQTGEAVDETVTPAVEDGASQTEALVAALPEDQQAEVVPLIEQAEAANPGVTDRIAEAIAPVEDAEQAADPAAQVPNEVQAELERLGIAQARTEDEVRQIIADQQRAVKAAEIARNEAQAATAQNLKGYLDQGGSLARSAYPQIAKAAGVSVQQVPQVLEAAASQGLLRKTSAGEFRRMLPQPTALGAVETIQQLAREMAPILPRGTVVRSFQELADLPTNVRGGLADLTGPVAAGQARPVVSQASGGPVDAFAQDGAIYIAGYAMNPQGRMSHEALHALVTAGVVEQGEIKILADRARKVGAFSKTREAQYERDYRKRYPTDWKRRLDEEAAAHLIEARANGADHGRRINAIVDRILQFVERLGNMLRRQGFRSANDVADAFFSGEMARRERVDAWMRENGASQQAHTGEPPVSGFPTLKDGKMFAIRAFHGSPHDFDKFDMSRIGTGEGAQAYGHGLYFAESPAVAHEYRATLSDTSLGNVIRLDGQRLADSPLSWLANGHLSSGDTTLTPIMARMEAANRSDTAKIAELRKIGGRQANLMIPDIERHMALRAAQIEQLSGYDGSGVLSRVEPGRLYEVRINAEPEQFLDWDKPLSQQSKSIQDAVNQRFENAGRNDWREMDLDGQNIYERLGYLRDRSAASSADWNRAASSELQDMGVRGLRYLDAGSRGTGDGSRNYVVFDDSLIEIVAKDGQPVTPQERADVTGAMTPGEPDTGSSNAMFAFRDEPKTPGLDMSKDARMKRAHEMGFDTGTVYYHGSPMGPFESFDPARSGTANTGNAQLRGFFFTPDQRYARSYAETAPGGYIGGKPYDVANPLHLAAVAMKATDGDADRAIANLQSNAPTSRRASRAWQSAVQAIKRGDALPEFDDTMPTGHVGDYFLRMTNPYRARGAEMDTLSTLDLQRRGFDGVIWDGGKEVVVFDPRNIRSVNAAFDPANADSPNLMFAFRDEPKTPGLDMSKDARMKRAQEMGFDTPLYHATRNEFDTFKPGQRGASFFAGSAEDAARGAGAGQREWIMNTATEPDTRPQRVMQVLVKSSTIDGLALSPSQRKLWASLPDAIDIKDYNETIRPKIEDEFGSVPPWMYDDGFVAMPDGRVLSYDDIRRLSDAEFERVKQLGRETLKKGNIPKFSYDDARRTGRDIFGREIAHWGPTADEAATAKRVRDSGMSGYLVQDEAGVSVAVVDPRNIRSVNAAFDPANADSPNLMFAFRGEDQPQANQGPAASLQSIVSDLAMDLGLTIRQGMRTAAAKAARRSGLQGLYDPRTGIIRVGSVADLSTVAQSAGDAIRHRFGAAIDQLIATNARDLARGAVATSAPTLKDTGYSGLDLDIEVQDAAIQAAIDKTQKPALDRMIGTATANAILKDVAGVARQGERDSFTSYLNNLAQRRDELTREMEAIRNRQAMPGPASANARSEIDRRMRELAQVMTLIRDGETRQARLEQSVLEDVTQRVRERFSETGTPKTPEAPSEQQLAQGYRQWFGDYLLSPEKARQDAPDFTSDLEAFLDAQDPVLLAKLEDSQAAIDAYFKSDPAALVEAMVRDATKANRWERFQEDRQRWGLGGALSLRASSFYTATIDTANPFAVAVKEALRIYERNNNTKLDLDTGANAYKLARLAPHSHAWATRDMERGIRDRRTNEHDGPGLIQALTTALGSNRAEAIDVGEGSRYRKFGSYLVARYAALEWERFANGEKDRAPTVQPPGTTDALSVAAWYGQVAASLEQQFPAFVDAAEQVYDYQQNLLKLQRDAGFLSAETYDQLVTDRTYVPFYRHFDEDELSAGRTLGGGGAGGILKRKRGSDRDVIDPIASIAQKTFETRHLIAQNDVKRALIQLAEAAGPGGGVIAERIEPKQLKAMAIDVERVVNDAAREAGVDTQDRASLIDLMQQVLGNDAVTQYYSQRTIQPGKLPITFFWENGELQAMQLGDGEHGHKLASQMMDVLNTFGKTHLDWLIKFAQIPAQTLRIGITTHPEFAVANIIRDALMAFQYDPKALPLWTQLKGMVDVVRGADYVQAYYANAGMMGGEATAALDKLRNERDIRALVGRGYKFKVFDSLSNMLSHADELFEARNWKDRVSGGVVGAVAGAATAGPVGAMAGSVIGTLVGGKAIVQVGEVSETATRARLYKHGFDRAKAQGLDDVAAAQEAAFWAHDYTDYSRRGSRMDGWAKVIPFLNANLQGNDIYIRRLFGKGDQSWNPGIMYPAYRLGLLDINKLSPKEQQELGLSAWTWAMSTLVLGSLSAMIALAWDDDERLKDIDDRVKSSHWLIPVDNDIILRIPKPFQTVWLSQAIERYVTEARHGNERFLEHYLDDLWNTWKPPVVPSIAELGATFTGYDINSGREVIPSWMRDQPRNLQYTAYTSDFAKWAGGQINVAPMYVDHVIQKFGASWGRTFLNLNIPGSAWYNPGKPTKGPEEEFIGRRFLWRVGRGSEAGKMIREMMGSEDPLPKIWGAIAQPISYYAARANEIRQMIEKPVPDHAKAVERLTQLPADERAYAILETYFRGRNEAKYRMLHPMNRAEKIARETIALEKMLIGGELLTGRKGKDQKEVPLPPSEKKAARDILTQLRMMEGHNALVIMEEPGWKGRMMFDTASVMAELKQASPATYKELTTRYGKSGIVSDSGIRYVWPEVKSRLEDQRWLEWVRKNRVAGQSGMLAGAWAKAQISRRPAVEAAPSNP